MNVHTHVVFFLFDHNMELFLKRASLELEENTFSFSVPSSFLTVIFLMMPHTDMIECDAQQSQSDTETKSENEFSSSFSRFSRLWIYNLK